MGIVRKIYLYLFSTIGLVIAVIGAVQLVDLGLKAWVFKKADVYLDYPRPAVSLETGKPVENEISKEELEKFNKTQLDSQRQRQAAGAIAMIVVGLPLYFYHWRIVKEETESRK